VKSNKTAPHDLATILSPVAADAFLSSDYGRNFRYVPGVAGKFSSLLPWPELNRILEQHRLDPPRLRLTREGKPVALDLFIAYQTNRRKSGQAIPRLNATALTRHLREGATLVLDAVDELHSPITRLVESLEKVFRVRVQVNAYAGWRTSHGFDLHWDDHDVFILQIAGCKQWKVYGVTRKYPLARDAERSLTPPSEPLWEGLLSDGDLLYIPRGWWHVATPLDEPTLHLTVGVNNPTGADFLSWFIDRLRAHEQVRRDIPHLAGAEPQRQFADCLRDCILAEWRPELIEEYMAEMDAKSRPRPHLSLPWTAAKDILPPDGCRYRWNGARAAKVASNGAGEVYVDTHGRRWKFAEAARPVLEALVSDRDLTMEDLHKSGMKLDQATLRVFLGELIANGLVVVC
jgi:hypothetical protein